MSSGTVPGWSAVPRALLEREHHADQPLLGAIVEIPLHAAAPFLLGRRHDPGSRDSVTAWSWLRQKLGLEPLVVESAKAEDRCYRADQRRILAQHRVMHDGGERSSHHFAVA